MLELEVLVVELRAVDALPARAVAAREVAPLDHEVGDDAVELAALEVQRLPRGRGALAALAEVNKIGHGLRHDAAEEPDGDPLRLCVSDLDVEVDLVGDLG